MTVSLQCFSDCPIGPFEVPRGPTGAGGGESVGQREIQRERLSHIPFNFNKDSSVLFICVHFHTRIHLKG